MLWQYALATFKIHMLSQDLTQKVYLNVEVSKHEYISADQLIIKRNGYGTLLDAN